LGKCCKKFKKKGKFCKDCPQVGGLSKKDRKKFKKELLVKGNAG
jgi:hypothetical protein